MRVARAVASLWYVITLHAHDWWPQMQHDRKADEADDSGEHDPWRVLSIWDGEVSMATKSYCLPFLMQTTILMTRQGPH